MKYVIDTNTLLSHYNSLVNYDVVITSHVHRELEKLEFSKDEAMKFLVRTVKRFLRNNEFEYDLRDYHFDLNEEYDPNYTDNKILQAAHENGFGIITHDNLLFSKAKGLGIEVIDLYENVNNDYVGYKEVVLSEDEKQHVIYRDLSNNRYGLARNEYLVIKNEQGEFIDRLIWNGDSYEQFETKSFKSDMFGEIEAKDAYQQCAINSLHKHQMVILSGHAGTGKTLLALSYLFHCLQRDRLDKIFISYNPMDAKGAGKLGFYPGTRLEKLLSKSLGSMLMSKLGDMMMVDELVKQEKLVIIPVGDIRGFEVPQKCGLYVTEAQNLDIELCKTLIQRTPDNAKLILEGDIDTQVDHQSFEGHNNGLRRAIDVFKGEDMFSYVNLPIIYRSRIAEIADRM